MSILIQFGFKPTKPARYWAGEGGWSRDRANAVTFETEGGADVEMETIAANGFGPARIVKEN